MSGKKRLAFGLILMAGLVGLGITMLNPAGAIANVAGFRHNGQTSDFLEANFRANRPLPTPEWVGVDVFEATSPLLAEPLLVDNREEGIDLATPNPVQSLEWVRVEVYFLPEAQVFYADHIFANRLERWERPGGPLFYLIEYDEAGLNQYLNYWFNYWQTSNSQIENVRFDLQPAGLIIYADVDLWLGQQRVGIVFTLDSSGRQFAFQGVDIGGELFSQPPAGPVADYIHQLVQQGNWALRDLRFLDPAGTTLTIQQIYLDQGTVQIIAK